MLSLGDSSARPEKDNTFRQLGVGVCLLLWGISLWAGAAVMSFELLGGRLLMPAFGTSLEVWAAVIAVTLGALAVGYCVGGRVADARPHISTLAVVLIIAGLSFVAVSTVGYRIPFWFLGFHFVAGQWCAAAILLAPSLLLLGMVQPMLAKILLPEINRAGAIFGGLLAVSTIGGIGGTAYTALILVPRGGTVLTLMILAIGTAVLGLVALILARCHKTAFASLVVMVVAILIAAYVQAGHPPVGTAKILERIEGRYGQWEVLEHQGMVALACNGVFQAALPSSGLAMVPGLLLRGRDYTELVPYLRPQATSVLIIGLGGGLHARMFQTYGFEVQTVEIEPVVPRLAAEYFGCETSVDVADGRAFLARHQGRYDAIVLDAFVGGDMPEHLYTREAFQQMADHLHADGVLVVHLIAPRRHPLTRAIGRTLQTVFEHILGAGTGLGNDIQHLYLFASCDQLTLASLDHRTLYDFGFTGQELFELAVDDAPLLTDDRTCLALLARDLVAEHRRRSLQIRRTSIW